MYLKGK